ncbi:MAG: Holliday junction resolvase RuvX [Synergistota bacterium]|nr:Holliday junction resolvase RuvX [Synergistota bacterium]
MKYIGVDIGSVRIGVAASDPLGFSARGVAVLQASGEWMEQLMELVREHDAGALVVGVPLRTTGERGPEAQKVLSIIAAMRKRFEGIEIIEWDERFTTRIATDALLEADVSRKGRKQVVDKVAAAILLRDYLESRRTP